MSGKNLRVLVLVGGTSAERDVSLATGQGVIDALNSKGHQVLALDTAQGKKLLDTTKPLLPQGIAAVPPNKATALQPSVEVLSALALPGATAIDVVFLALHGGHGEDGHIQALLDMARAPYTGSGPTASALAMNKHLAKKIFRAESIPTPEWVFLDRTKKERVWSSAALTRAKGAEQLKINTFDGLPVPEYDDLVELLGQPFVVKPNEQGSTVGLSIVEGREQLDLAIAEAFHHGPGVILEQYIAGRELTVAVLGEQTLPVVEIIPKHGIYDYECKYTTGKSQYVCPADLTVNETKYLQSLGYQAFNALGCSGYARVDFRRNPSGEYYCLEVNTLPGMTATSLVPKAAAAIGIDFPELIDRICRLAIK